MEGRAEAPPQCGVQAVRDEAGARATADSRRAGAKRWTTPGRSGDGAEALADATTSGPFSFVGASSRPGGD
jgi:hypothetical protein